MNLAPDLTVCRDISAIDHHSHASASPGRTVSELQEHFATAHVEANLPEGVYEEYVQARNAHDRETLDRLDDRYGVGRLLKESLGFRETTVFAHALRDGCSWLHGESEIEKVKATRPHEETAVYERALALAGTPVVFTDVPYLDRRQWHPDHFRQVMRIDPYLYPFGHQPRSWRGTEFNRFASGFYAVLIQEFERLGRGGPPSTLPAYLEFVEASLDYRCAQGVVGLKLASAYVRSLEFDAPDKDAAKAEYSDLVMGKPGDRRVLENYLTHYIARYAISHGLPMQIHVGMGHPEPGMRIQYTDPLLLEKFIATPALATLRIVLLHGAYPFSSHAAALAQTYGNVYLDFSWMPYLHGRLLTRMLSEWLELLPANKVIYGSDTGAPEFHVSASLYARRALDAVLGEGQRLGQWSTRETEWLARRVLAQNAADVYRIEGPS